MNRNRLDDLSWAMSQVYSGVEDRIMINLAKYFPMVHAKGQMTGSFEYQARMLGKMGSITKETVAIIAGSLGNADEALRRSLTTAILDALQGEEGKLIAAAKKGLLTGIPGEIAPSMMQAFRTYYQQSADKLNLVNTVMLESTQAAYTAAVTDAAARIQQIQGALNLGAGEVITGVSAWNQAMRTTVQSMVKAGITGYIDHAGRRWSPEAYVAMDIRTTMFNTSRAAVWERNQQYNNDLYQVSSHMGARPLCYPWQGKVLSTSGRTGTTTDLDGNEVVIHSEAEVESFRYGGGLFGVNCGHYPMVFIPGFSTLKDVPQAEEENAKTYAESQQQRALERKLREEKRDLEVMKAQGVGEDAIKAQRERVRRASGDLDTFCEETGRHRDRAREYTPIDAKWPDPSTYDPTKFPTAEREKIREWFANGGRDNPSPTTPVPQNVKLSLSKTYTLNDAVKTTETVTINRGTGSELLLSNADVYTMPDGTKFIFKSGMDTAHQKATPKFAIEQWYKTPQAIRDKAQKEIAFVDVYNPDDAHWKTVYKNFTQSYATGGDQITFWRWDYDHDPAYFVRSFNHEMAHKVDTVLGGGTRYSLLADWQKAMADDLAFSGLHSITTYGANSPAEDFAESIAEYIRNRKLFLQKLPNRGKIITNIILQGGILP